MVNKDPVPDPMFGDGVVKKLLLFLLFLAIVVGLMLAFTNGAFAEGKVIKLADAPAAKIVAPKPEKVEEPELLPQEVEEIKTVEITPQPDLITTTVLTIHRPDAEQPAEYDPDAETVQLLISYFQANGCTAILGGELNWKQKMLAKAMNKSNCVLITVEQSVVDMLPEEPELPQVTK